MSLSVHVFVMYVCICIIMVNLSWRQFTIDTCQTRCNCNSLSVLPVIFHYKKMCLPHPKKMIFCIQKMRFFLKFKKNLFLSRLKNFSITYSEKSIRIAFHSPCNAICTFTVLNLYTIFSDDRLKTMNVFLVVNKI